MISIKLLGRPVIKQEEKNIHIPRRKSRALLFYTAAHSQPVSREDLLELLWPDLPRASALQTLRTSLYNVRQVLENSILVDSSNLSLTDQIEVDAVAFLTGMKDAGDRIEELEKALSLYTGEFLQGFYLPESAAFENWLNMERERYRQTALKGFSYLADLHKEKQDYQSAIHSLDKALHIQPLQEDLQRERILLHHLAGDRPGAIQRYDELRKLLDQELGVPPMLETRELYNRILSDDVSGVKAEKSLLKVQARKPLRKGTQELPFVGRENELILIKRELKLGKFVLIDGEAGIGKTRLTTELIKQMNALGLLGAAQELEQHLPYQPVIEALRSLVNSSKWARMSVLVQTQLPKLWLHEVARILPELNPEKSTQTTSDLGADESRLWEGIRQFLLVIAQIQPLVFVLDDLQWAGDSSLGLFSYMIRQGERPGLSFLATARPASDNPIFRSFIQSLSRQDLVVTLSLSRLSPRDVLDLAHSISPQYAPPLAEWLQRTSEGNPYILAELVKYARQKSIIQANGVINLSDLSNEPLIPQTVYSLLQTRLEALSDQARRILDAGVAMGRRFNIDVVASAAGLSELASLDAIDELLDRGLVRQDSARHFLIDHSLILEVAYREAGDLRHRYLHRRVAEAIESQTPTAMTENAGLLAWHFSEAGDLEKAASYARIAGNQALELAAWHEAIEYFQTALKSKDHSQHVNDWKAMAEAHAKTGEFVQATEAYREAIALAQKHDQPEAAIAVLRLAMARSMLPQGRYPEVMQIAQKVCDKAGQDSVIIAQLIWGTALSLEGADLTLAQEHLSAAEELYRQNPGLPGSTLGQILFESGSVAAQQGDLDQAIIKYQQALETAMLENDSYGLELRILAYNNLAYHKLLLGKPEAESDAQKGLELAQSYGILGMQTYLYSTLGEIALKAQAYPQAESYFQKGLELAKRFRVPERVAGLAANLGVLAQQRGQADLALHYLSTALGQAQSLGTKHLEAQIHLWLAPMLPVQIAKQHLQAAKEIAQQSGRRLLLDEVSRIEQALNDQKKETRTDE